MHVVYVSNTRRSTRVCSGTPGQALWPRSGCAPSRESSGSAGSAGRVERGYSQPLVKMALQCVQTRVVDVTRPAQYGHLCCCTAFETPTGTKNSTTTKGPNTSPATIPRAGEKPRRSAAT